MASFIEAGPGYVASEALAFFGPGGPSATDEYHSSGLVSLVRAYDNVAVATWSIVDNTAEETGDISYGRWAYRAIRVNGDMTLEFGPITYRYRTPNHQADDTGAFEISEGTVGLIWWDNPVFVIIDVNRDTLICTERYNHDMRNFGAPLTYNSFSDAPELPQAYSLGNGKFFFIAEFPPNNTLPALSAYPVWNIMHWNGSSLTIGPNLGSIIEGTTSWNLSYDPEAVSVVGGMPDHFVVWSNHYSVGIQQYRLFRVNNDLSVTLIDTIPSMAVGTTSDQYHLPYLYPHSKNGFGSLIHYLPSQWYDYYVRHKIVASEMVESPGPVLYAGSNPPVNNLIDGNQYFATFFGDKTLGVTFGFGQTPYRVFMLDSNGAVITFTSPWDYYVDLNPQPVDPAYYWYWHTETIWSERHFCRLSDKFGIFAPWGYFHSEERYDATYYRWDVAAVFAVKFNLGPEPPLRMAQRDDGLGVDSGHARMTGRQEGANASASYQRSRGRLIKNIETGYR